MSATLGKAESVTFNFPQKSLLAGTQMVFSLSALDAKNKSISQSMLSYNIDASA